MFEEWFFEQKNAVGAFDALEAAFDRFDAARMIDRAGKSGPAGRHRIGHGERFAIVREIERAMRPLPAKLQRIAQGGASSFATRGEDGCSFGLEERGEALPHVIEEKPQPDAGAAALMAEPVNAVV